MYYLISILSFIYLCISSNENDVVLVLVNLSVVRFHVAYFIGKQIFCSKFTIIKKDFSH